MDDSVCGLSSGTEIGGWSFGREVSKPDDALGSRSQTGLHAASNDEDSKSMGKRPALSLPDDAVATKRARLADIGKVSAGAMENGGDHGERAEKRVNLEEEEEEEEQKRQIYSKFGSKLFPQFDPNLTPKVIPI